MNTAIIIAGIICGSLVLMCTVKCVSDAMGSKSFYDAYFKYAQPYDVDDEEDK